MTKILGKKGQELVKKEYHDLFDKTAKEHGYTSEELQKNRLITRDKISEKEAYELINFQLSFEEKRKFSDIILDNSDDQNKWIQTIRELL